MRLAHVARRTLSALALTGPYHCSNFAVAYSA